MYHLVTLTQPDNAVNVQIELLQHSDSVILILAHCLERRSKDPIKFVLKFDISNSNPTIAGLDGEIIGVH